MDSSSTMTSKPLPEQKPTAPAATSVMRAALGQQSGMTMMQTGPTKSTMMPDDATGGGLRGFTVAKQVERLTQRGVQKTLQAEYFFVYDNQMTFDAFLSTNNMDKNRYQNIILWDETRVVLRDDWAAKHGDYVHASFADGYNRLGEYILAQAPFSDYTERLYWRAVLQEKPSIILLLTPLADRHGRTHCNKFWPNVNEETNYFHGRLKVRCNKSRKITEGIEEYEVDVIFIPRDPKTDPNVESRLLPLPNTQPQTTSVRIIWFDQWSTDSSAIPDSLLHFRNLVNVYRDAIWKAAGDQIDNGVGGVITDTLPVFVTCPTGVHRAGTYVAMDIILERFNKSGKVDIDGTVKQLRQERWGVVQQLHHYIYLVETVLAVDKLNLGKEGRKLLEKSKCERKKVQKSGASAQPLNNLPEVALKSTYTTMGAAPLAARPAAAERQTRL